MEDEDDFGDLYTDVLHGAHAPTSLPANQKPTPTAPAVAGGSGSDSDEEHSQNLHGSSLPYVPVKPSASIDRERQVFAEDADDDWLLGRDPAPVEEPANWVEDDEEEVMDRDSDEVVKGLSFKGAGARVLEKVDAEEAIRVSEEEEVAVEGEGSLKETQELRDDDDGLLIPGLATPAVYNGVLVKTSESDDWDSGSEDDLQIVLNDTGHDILGLERRDGAGSDEDDEDLVIVTDDDQRHHHQGMEEQDWGDDATQSAVDGEKKEMLEVAKGSGAVPTVPGAVIGYSNHGFHPQHHSMFKYVRPGATPTPRGPGVVATSAPGQIRPPSFGPVAGRGRGDWRSVGGGGFSSMQKGFHSAYGLSAWGNIGPGRSLGSGLDFSLPAHKTVFDIDIESFEEKPWRHPGVDISDFFNFGLDEEHWKEYCKQLEQLRLESTMQGKIRVYESGRSEQDYDPDLPPELAAATGHNNAPADNMNHDKSENGLADLSDHGKGSAFMRPSLPTGRPIQVESGYGERLPSIDTRPPRFRDLDAVIEIVLQDNMGDSRNSNSASEQPENNLERENQKTFHDVDEDDRPAESESEFYGRFQRSSNVQPRESVVRRIPTSVEGDGLLPFPSESSRQYNPNPKLRSPVDTARSFETQHGARSLQRTSFGKNPNASEHSTDIVPVRLDKHEGHHKERAIGGIEVDKAYDSPPSDMVRESSMEPKGVEHDDALTLGDSHEGDGGEASDLRVSSETVGDDGFINPADRQKFISHIEQTRGQENGIGDDSRLTHSDNSRARSGTSRDYQKLHETGEEVVQVHPSKHIGDLSKHHEEDDRRQRDDYGRDERREASRNRSRGRETMHELYAPKDWDSGSGYTFRGRSADFEREMDGSAGNWQRREDDIHYRQVKDEDIRRVYNDEIRPPRERNKVRMIDRKEKIEDHAKKRMDDGDWRVHGRDDGYRHRERNDILMNRRDSLEDGQMKRKRDVELSRRERADKEDSLHGYNRVREDSHRKKKIRDDTVDYRKREDDVRTKSKIEERYSGKHKDDSWYPRDREDRNQFNLVHDDLLTLPAREERRFASRSGRPMEKVFGGAGRSKEDLKVAGSEKVYHDNDRRRHSEQSKRGDRIGEEIDSSSKLRSDAHIREKRFNADQRSMRHERLSAHHPDRLPGASDEHHQMQKERHRESNKKVEDSEHVGQQKGLSGNKKKRGGHNTHRTELNSKGTIEQQSSKLSAAESKKPRAKIEQMEAALLPSARRGDEDAASDGESHDSRRGRSKLERWTSHKERDYSVIIDNNIQTNSIIREVEDTHDELNESAVKADANKPDDTETNADDPLQVAADRAGGEERDRHLDTVAKLKMRSERFKLPMPGEKDKDLPGNKRVETMEAPPPPSCIHNEAVSAASAAELDIKLERPARKRKWTGS